MGGPLLFGKSIRQLLLQPVFQLADRNPDLIHGVALTDSDAVVSGRLVVAYSLEVHGDAVGSTLPPLDWAVYSLTGVRLI